MKIERVETFQVQWSPDDQPAMRSAFVRIHADDGLVGIGEASPMQGGRASLSMIDNDIASALVGADPLDHAVLQDRLLHRLVKLGPEGALTGALAAIDIALWDLKGKLLGQPIYKLIGGAWRTSLPFYASIGRNSVGQRTVDEVCRIVEARMRDNPAAIKIRFDNDRTKLDQDIAGDIEKARAVRRLVGDDFPLAFDANNGLSFGGAIRVGRALEELGYWWFEEPLQHYHPRELGALAQKLDITVSAGEQSYTSAAIVDLIDSGVRMVQPDIVKMGGITGLLRCAALCQAHGVELVPHQTQPTIGHLANLHVCATQLHATKPCELDDPSSRRHAIFANAPKPMDGLFHLPTASGLGIDIDETALEQLRVR
ncbi:mandelate racemase/muconate lactonizing enzyme family protein [Neorhizobium sp. P12A]|uniref:mandelate racemase/muconate lactonizing enzyme family protein n=1 Tax=Neorhizobium sp. P12A TaxID=2268027 RepID=UPI0011EFAB62|nr:mandelate racemase/muconate lactonizing enzyme family protein [Neorhizobium sp. P12A]KAA0691948.1 mandelate racemase/muconate lactonizing enzyme family protein [Neorhizobium sp. P12A]